MFGFSDAVYENKAEAIAYVQVIPGFRV